MAAKEKPGRIAGPPLFNPLLWPMIMSAAASGAAASLFTGVAANWLEMVAPRGDAPEPQWATANRTALELASMRLRDFSTGATGQPVLICAPYALHGATIADFAPGHSVVEALRRGGVSHVFVTDWRSATPDMRFFNIDSYLADLNVAVDEFGAPVDLVGLCQGGWLSLVYAARFPSKVRRLVLVGAPVDTKAAASDLSRAVASAPFAMFENLVRLGDGRVIGKHVLETWTPTLDAADSNRVLQATPDLDAAALRDLDARYREWLAWTLDLPGVYYLEAVRRLYRENQIANGKFVALGRRIDLAKVHAPLFLLAARDDDVVAPGQLFAAAGLVGCAGDMIERVTEPCGHLSLFMGARTLAGTWIRIAHWLGGSQPAMAC